MITKQRLDEIKKLIADEDEQITPPMPTGVTSPIKTTTPTGTEEDKDEETDPLMDYILQQIEQNKQKQIQTAQADYAQREQDAQKIVSDIEEFIKKNQK
jgi:hypothetical protein